MSLTVVGNPATGPWGVTATTTNPQDVMADVRLDGVKHHVESHAHITSLAITARRSRPGPSALVNIWLNSYFTCKIPRPRSGGPASPCRKGAASATISPRQPRQLQAVHASLPYSKTCWMLRIGTLRVQDSRARLVNERAERGFEVRCSRPFRLFRLSRSSRFTRHGPWHRPFSSLSYL